MKKKMNSTTTMIGLAAVVFLVLIGAAMYQNFGPSKYDDFAQCLTDAGAVMYGASWCSACEAQKADFGSAFRKINYVECAVPDGTRNLDLCAEEGIENSPTWEKADGERLIGAVPFGTLAEEFGCQLPE